MSSLDYDSFDNFVNPNVQKQDEALLVKFFHKSVPDKEATEKEGRPIYKEVEYCDIKIPGNKSGGACRPATQMDKKRFPRHYAAFKDRTGAPEDMGTPLAEWPVISRSQVDELGYFHVKTVEQLANMSDSQIGKFMGLSAIREKAKKWLEHAEKEKPMWELDQKNRALRQELDEMKETVKKLIEFNEKQDPDLNERQQERAKTRLIKAAKQKV